MLVIIDDILINAEIEVELEATNGPPYNRYGFKFNISQHEPNFYIVLKLIHDELMVGKKVDIIINNYKLYNCFITTLTHAVGDIEFHMICDYVRPYENLAERRDKIINEILNNKNM